MAHLIDKDALVAEINERIDRNNENAASYSSGSEHDYLYRFERKVYKNLLSFIGTLEVKEVNLEKYYYDFLQKEWFDKNCTRTISEMMFFTAKHFFELGLKVSKKGE